MAEEARRVAGTLGELEQVVREGLELRQQLRRREEVLAALPIPDPLPNPTPTLTLTLTRTLTQTLILNPNRNPKP